jgi:trehalose synthase
MRPEREPTSNVGETHHAPRPAHLDDYRSIVGEAVVEELRCLARGSREDRENGEFLAVGGGVAGYRTGWFRFLGELDVITHWDVITGGNDFFEVTKAFHNALHG